MAGEYNKPAATPAPISGKILFLRVARLMCGQFRHEIEFIFVAQQFDIAFNFVSDVRDNLDGLAKIVTTTFLVDYTLVDTSGSDVVGFGSLDA